MNTCDTCYLMHPSEAPSPTPSVLPSDHPSLSHTDCPTEDPSPKPTMRSNPPSAGPTVSPTCAENPNEKFFWKYKSDGTPIFKKCSWLKSRYNFEKICRTRTSSCYDGTSQVGPAREVCMNTCNTCHLVHPSQAPSKVPSPSPTQLHHPCPTC